MKKIISLVTALFVLLSMTAFAARAATEPLKQAAQSGVDYLLDTLEAEDYDFEHLAAILGANNSLKDEKYQEVSISYTADQFTETTRITTWASSVLAMRMQGYHPAKYFKDRDLLQELAAAQNEQGMFVYKDDKGELTGGTNDLAWAMLTLDTLEVKYDISKAIAALKSLQNHNKGFGYAQGLASDVDLTGMILATLSRHMDNADAKAMIDSAVEYLRSRVDADGYFVSEPEAWGSPNNCSQAYAIIGLAAVGEDVRSDEWTLNGKNVLDVLLSNQGEDGGFYMNKANPPAWQNPVETDDFTTKQTVMAINDIAAGSLFWDRMSEQIPLLNDGTSSQRDVLSSGQNDANTDTGDNSSSTVVIVIFIAVVAIGLLVIYFALGKKKPTDNQTHQTQDSDETED